MNRQSPQFCIVDPNLRDFVGHHFEYDLSVASMAARRGLDPLVLGHAEVKPDISTRIPVRPAFTLDIWAAHPDRKGTSTDDDIMLCNRSFYRDLLAGLKGVRMARDTVIFGHMITAKQLLGWAWFAQKFGRNNGPTIILLLRYQRSFYESKACEQAFRMLERAARRGSVRLASDSARLVVEIGGLTSLPIEEFSIPHTTHTAFESTPHAPLRPPDVLRLVSLGDARDEKGILEILDAVRILHAEGRAESLEFVLQVSNPQPAIGSMIEEFAALQLPRVTLLRDPLESDAYYELLCSAHGVLAPYWRSIYEARTSGIFLEAVAAGKPVICTDDTWMSDQLRVAGAGELCRDHDSRDLIRAIEAVQDHYVALAERALSTRSQWIARHNAARLLDQIVDGQPLRAPSVPPKRIAVLYPWGDILSGGSGAAVRVNLMLEFLQHRVEEIRVLQTGESNGRLSNKIRVEAYNLQTEAERRMRRWFDRICRFLFRIGPQETNSLWWHLAPLFDRQLRRRIIEIVRWADVVLLEYTFWGRFVEQACRLTGRRCILSNHDVLSNQVSKSNLLWRATRYFEFRAMAHADAAVTVAPADQAQFAEAGIATTMIANPIDTDLSDHEFPGGALHLLEVLYDIPLHDEKIALFVGSKHKPNEIAADSIRVIATELARLRPDASIRFIVAGGCAEPLRDNNFWALGRVDDFVLNQLYAHASLIIVPLPFGTGASLKTIEALAHRKAVLGTAMAFRGLEVTSGRECMIENSLDEYPLQILELVGDEDRLAQLAERGRAFAQDYDYRKIYAHYLPLLGVPDRPVRASEDKIAKGEMQFRPTVRALAAKAVTRQRWQEARMLLDRLLSANPDDGESNFLMGEVLSWQIPPDPAARTYYDRALDGQYDGFEIYRARARLSLASADPEAAEQEEATAIRLKVNAAAIDSEFRQFREVVWKLFFAKEYEFVVKLCRALRAQYPDRPNKDVEYLIAQALHSMNRELPTALEHYDRALALGFDRYWARHHRGRLLRELGHGAKADAEIQQAMALNPELQKASLEPLWQMFFAGKYEDVLAGVASALTRNPDDGELHYLAAQSLHSARRDLETALEHYDRALVLGFDEFWIRYHRGRLLRELGHGAKADAEIQRAIALNPRDLDLQKEMRAALLEPLWQQFFAGKYDDVLAGVAPALTANPDDGELHYLAAQSLHSLCRDLETALEHYDRALQLGFDEQWIRYHRARLLRELGHGAEADAEIQRAMALNPQNPELKKAVHSVLLESLWRMFFAGKYEKVLAGVAPALIAVPDDGESHYLAAQSLHSLRRDLETALEHYDRALVLGFDKLWIRYHRGRLLRELGYGAKADAEIQRAMALNPQDPELKKAIHDALLEPLWQMFFAERYESALAGAVSALAANPDDGELHYLAARTLHSLRREPARAIHHYDRALQFGFDEYRARYHRRNLLKDIGRMADANEELARATPLHE